MAQRVARDLLGRAIDAVESRRIRLAAQIGKEVPQRSREDLSAEAAKLVPHVQILDLPHLPEVPDSPNRPVILLTGLLCGVAAGLVVALIAYLRRASSASPPPSSQPVT